MEKEAFALLKVIESNVSTIKEDIREMKESMRSKVEVKDFDELKTTVSKLNDKSEALHNKWWFASGIATSISYLFSHFIK